MLTHLQPPHNLPLPLNSFIGREEAVKEVKWFLTQSRLLTLTGPGGTGKTRLAIASATELLCEFGDGVWLVQLAPLTDGALLPQALFTVLGLSEQADEGHLEILKEHLHNRRLLLLLDNCEHLIGAVATLTEALLHHCPTISIVATSREALHISGERVWIVPPLTLPAPLFDHEVETLPLLLQSEAVRLFRDRAVAVQPDFAITNTNVSSVAKICRDLDGLPLAIELAAAHVRFLPIDQIAIRLSDRFTWLNGGRRTAPPHQQTLLATLEWSFDLLTDAERALLRRLSLFRGGWTLESAEAICADHHLPSASVFRLLALLIDKSLVSVEHQNHGSRYRMLETIRQFAYARLMEANEVAVTRHRHLTYFLQWMAAAEWYWIDAQQGTSLAQVEGEIDNLRVALAWSFDQTVSDREERGGLSLSGLPLIFRDSLGHYCDGARGLAALLTRPESTEIRAKAARARVLCTTGFLLGYNGHYREARLLLEQAMVLAQEVGEVPLLAEVSRGIGWEIAFQGDYAMAVPYLQQSVDLWRGMGTIGNSGLAQNLIVFGTLTLLYDDPERAKGFLQEGVTLLKASGERNYRAMALRRLGQVALRQGNQALATTYFRESLELNRAVGSERGVLADLVGLARMFAQGGHPLRAIRLLGAVQTLLGNDSDALPVGDRTELTDTLELVRLRVRPATFEAAWASGSILTLEQAIALTYNTTFMPETQVPLLSPTQNRLDELTAREREVATLIALGKSNREIGETLVVSLKTVEAHSNRLRQKLGITSRAGIALWAMEQGLIPAGTPQDR